MPQCARSHGLRTVTMFDPCPLRNRSCRLARIWPTLDSKLRSLDMAKRRHDHECNSYLEQEPSCPKCLRKLDGFLSTSWPNMRPRPGDYTNCVHCGAMLEFTHNLGLVPMTDKTAVKVAGTADFVINNEMTDWLRNRGDEKLVEIARKLRSRELKRCR